MREDEVMAILMAIFHGIGVRWNFVQHRLLRLLGERIRRQGARLEAVSALKRKS